MDKFWFASAVFEGQINYKVQIGIKSGIIHEINTGVEKCADDVSFEDMALPGFIDTHCHGGGGYFFSNQDHHYQQLLLLFNFQIFTNSII
jgi:N-acetylglucosamine-6-phosphate deacetylase